MSAVVEKLVVVVVMGLWRRWLFVVCGDVGGCGEGGCGWRCGEDG